MFGLLRTVLALMVVVSHLWLTMPPLGTHAVFGFYIISGYLMTFVMQESYGYSGGGKWSFAVNRFLRLYPQYWIACLLSLFLIFVIGADPVLAYHYAMSVPASLGELISNICMMFLAWRPVSVTPILSPSTWALTVELFFYALICMGISRNPARVRIWFVLSLAYVPITYAMGLPWQDRYFPVAAASLPFSIGAGIYFLAKNDPLYSRFAHFGVTARTLFLLVLANSAVWSVVVLTSADPPIKIGFYINLALCSLLVYSIAKGGVILTMPGKLDKAIGDYSYPMYLLHWQAGIIASYLLFGLPLNGRSLSGFATLLVALPVLLLLSVACIRFIDQPIQLIRARVKSRSPCRSQSSEAIGEYSR